MIIELNIGLEVANGDNSMKARSARAVVASVALAGWATFDRRYYSDTEDTLVMVCHVPSEDTALFNETIFALAQATQQDCIAVYYATGWAGELIGPNAAAWGAFNPDFFIRYEPNDGPAKIFTKAPESKTQYTGHGAATGGLQGHSMGTAWATSTRT